MSEAFVLGQDFHNCVLGKPFDPWQQKETRINGLPQNTIWKVFPDTTLRSSVAKFKRNLKMTVFQEMGIESKLLNQM